jgi:hypothetical protein
MNNSMYTVLNADIPVINVGVSVHVHVKVVIRHSVKRAICQRIKAYIVLSAFMFVMCVMRHSITGAF